MEEALLTLKAYELWIYLLLALGGMVYIRKFFLAWQELRGAAFGLERQSAQTKLNQSASVTVLLLALAMTEFALVSFFVPSLPGANPLPTSTLNLLATPTTTLAIAVEQAANEQTSASTPGTPIASAEDEGCIPGQITISSPVDGSQIEGITVISGTVNVENFGFYKLEMKRPEETNWLTILAGNNPVFDGTLGSWNTTLLPPGEHELSLVVSDNQGQILPACTIRVRIVNAPEN